MTEFLLNIDIMLFYFINQTIINSPFDFIMPFITDIKNWYLIYIFLFAWLFWKGGRHGRIAALTLILAIIISDQLSSSVIKELVGRIRPCSELPDVRLLVSCGAGKSFPSSHAANSFAMAAILSFFYKEYKYIYFSIAALISLSRVYTGVHYPSDIAAGAFLGFIISGILIIFIKKFYRRE